MSQEDMVIEEIDIEQVAKDFIIGFNRFYDDYSNKENVKEAVTDKDINNNIDKYDQDYFNIKSYIDQEKDSIFSIPEEFANSEQVSRINFLKQIEESLEAQQILDRIQYLRNVYPLIPVSNTNDVPMNLNDSFPGPVYDPDPEIHHIFLFIAHGEEYNISGNRHYYPFHQPLFNSLGIISDYGVTAHGDDLRANLTLNKNIFNILGGRCEINTKTTIHSRNLVTVNPLRLQFRYEDSQNSHLGPYMGLFYIKARGGQNNQAELLKMEHIVRFKNAAELIKVDSIPTVEPHKYTLHNITRGNVDIKNNFNDNEWFGWDRVINFIADFYRQGLQIDDEGRPLIIPGEQTHIRLYTCRAEAVPTGTILGVPNILTDYALYDAERIEHDNNHNLRYFTADGNNITNFVNNKNSFQTFIESFVDALNSVPYQITVNPNMLCVYLLSLIDKNVLDQNNINIFRERVSCIFTDVENNDIEQLFVMMTLDKNGVDEYIKRNQDITAFSALDIDNMDVFMNVFTHGLNRIDLGTQIQFCIFKMENNMIDKNSVVGVKIYFIGEHSLYGITPCVLFIHFIDTENAGLYLAGIHIQEQGDYSFLLEERYTTYISIYENIASLLSSFNNIKIIYSIDNIISGGMSNLPRYSKEAEKAREAMKISKNSFDPEIVVQKQKGPSAAETYYKDLLAFKEQLERAEEAKKRAKESETGATNESGKYVFSTPKKKSTLKDPNSAVSAKTDSPYSPYSPYSQYKSSSSPLFQSIGNVDNRQGSNVLTSVSDPTLTSIRGSPSFEQLERLVPNDAASDATSGDSGPSSQTTTPATSPERKKNPTNKNPPNDDSQGTQTEMNTQDEPLEFGGKKKGKKGKKTKRANNAKKARKTKKKRSNKK